MKYFLVITIKFIVFTGLYSQNISYQLSPIYGYKFQKNNFFSEPISGFTFDINRTTDGSKYWQYDHNYPQMGIQLMARDFDKNSPHHLTFSVIPYLEFNLLKNNSGTLQIKHGTGLAYAAGKKSNNENSLLGSKLNASSIIDFGYKFNTGKQLNLKPGILVSHISNGNLVSPNKGINALFAYLQLSYNLSSIKVELIQQEKITITKRWRQEYRLSFGLYDYVKKEKTIGLQIQHMCLQTYTHNTRFRSGFGTEIMHDRNLKKFLLSVYAEENVLIGHLVTRYGIGVYVTNIPINSSRIYEKVGIAWFPFRLRDAIGQGLCIGADIKAHKFKGVMIDLNAGFLF